MSSYKLKLCSRAPQLCHWPFPSFKSDGITPACSVVSLRFTFRIQSLRMEKCLYLVLPALLSRKREWG